MSPIKIRTKCKIKDDSELMEMIISGKSCPVRPGKGFDFSVDDWVYSYINYTLSQQCMICGNKIEEEEKHAQSLESDK